MNLKKKSVKFLSIFLVLLSLIGMSPLNAFAADTDSEATGHALVITSDSLSVKIRKTVQLHASVTNVDTMPAITWASLNPDIATVDENGVVKGVSIGKAVITASVTVDGETINGEFVINVVDRGNFIQDFLTKRQVLSYQYSYIDDYYYTNDKEAWQYNFGFGKIYDFVSPYILLEYDYIRIFFTYEGKDWMLQMWKGQYGLVFYGGEIGIYNRPHDEEGIGAWTFFNCPAEEDWLKMEMTLWHEDMNGNWNREFTREYDYYWWCTGFKNGHLRQEEPADELRLTGRITFKDAEMTSLVASGLVECGLAESQTRDGIALDGFCVEGNDIYFSWQNISEAESTMWVKVSAGVVGTLLLLPVAPILLPFVGAYAVLVLLVSAIL